MRMILFYFKGKIYPDMENRLEQISAIENELSSMMVSKNHIAGHGERIVALVESIRVSMTVARRLNEEVIPTIDGIVNDESRDVIAK